MLKAHEIGQLDGKLAVITGAATGIGRATADLFARAGARVVIGDINDKDGVAAAAAIRQHGREAWYLHVDVADGRAMDAFMNEASRLLGGIDIVINNAGVQRSGSVTRFDEGEWDTLMRVNAKSIFLSAKYSVPHLRVRGGGAIVNMASAAGLKGGPGITAYSASKGAVVGFTRALAAELASDHIRVNCICPGWVDTPFNQPLIDFMGGRDRQAEIVRLTVPMQRQGTPAEIAWAFLFLASDAASYVTGQALVVDGGLL